jgi:hypothetical protein
MQTLWIVVGVLVAAGLWWVLVIRKAPTESAASAQNNAMTQNAKVNTQSVRTIRMLAGLTLLAWPVLWLAAAGEESWMLFFAGCAAASQGIFLWGFGDIIENLAHIRHNTNTVVNG